MKRAKTGKAKTRTANTNKGVMWDGNSITEGLLNNLERLRRNPMQRLSAAAYTTSEQVSDDEFNYYMEMGNR